MSTMEKLEEYLESLEELVFASLSSASPDNLRETVNQLWLDITRYGPAIPDISQVRLPSLGDFEVPPPPPPPPPRSWTEKCYDWVDRNPWEAGGIVAGAVGAGLLVGYGGVYMRAMRARRLKAASTERRQVVVVLGGDTPLGLPLILDLENKGYIVVASVSTPEAAEALEQQCHGYVRALVLVPSTPEAVQGFLRSLASTLSRRFPITAAGDPYASITSHPYIQSIVSLLTLSAPAVHAPLEHLSLQETYLPYLNATQVTPLQVIQSLLPLLRNAPARGKKTIVVCVPATEARIGLPFSAVQSMSTAGTLRAVEVLRREINVASLTGKSENMKNIKVVVADVGAFDVNATPTPQDVYKAMEKWTASEKTTYGAAYAAIAHQQTAPASSWSWRTMFRRQEGQIQYGVPRKPTDVTVFVDNIVGVVSNGQYGPTFLSFGLGLGKIVNWIRGERFSIGAGARTYQIASFLPSLLLDTLLNIPHFLISVRNALLPTQPFVHPPPDVPPTTATAGPAVPPVAGVARREHHTESGEDESGASSNNELSETGSEADVESNEGDHEGPGVESSWINLKKAQGSA